MNTWISYICYTEDNFIECQKIAIKDGWKWQYSGSIIIKLDNMLHYEFPIVLHLYENKTFGWDNYEDIVGDIDYEDYNFKPFINRKRKLKTILKKS